MHSEARLQHKFHEFAFRSAAGVVYQSRFARIVTHTLASEVSVLSFDTRSPGGDIARVNGVDMEFSGEAIPGPLADLSLNLGSRNGASAFFPGAIYGFLIRGGAGVSSDVERVEKFLSDKIKVPA